MNTQQAFEWELVFMLVVLAGAIAALVVALP